MNVPHGQHASGGVGESFGGINLFGWVGTEKRVQQGWGRADRVSPYFTACAGSESSETGFQRHMHSRHMQPAQADWWRCAESSHTSHLASRGDKSCVLHDDSFAQVVDRGGLDTLLAIGKLLHADMPRCQEAPSGCQCMPVVSADRLLYEALYSDVS